ncbi:MAG: TonB-dependent receptor plug domain-containing protein [Chitinophagales bacterium]|nr:TonB-dependent receptor [Sphingobacteriales bacterium]
MSTKLKFILGFYLISICNGPIYSQFKTVDTVIINNVLLKNSLSRIVRTKSDIEHTSSYTLIDELSKLPSVNIQSRGFLGSQADISIRGSTYEQVAILFNGIKINHPQTGHNNMMLPIPLEFIDQIEVIQNGNAKHHGANAFAGAIELNTMKPKKTQLTGQLSLGSYQTVSSSALLDIVKDKHWHKLGVSYINSNGYRSNTDNNTFQIYSENHLSLGTNNRWQAYATAAIHSKKFGANGFYSLRFPDQYEELQSYFYNVGIKNENFKFNGYWNQINDYYLLRRSDPSFYQNRHSTDVRGASIDFNRPLSKQLTIASQFEYKNENLKSNNLGLRNRTIINGNINLGINTKFLYLNLGGNFNYIDKISPFITGGTNLVFKLNKQHSFFSSINSVFRIPSFTELYYTSPTDSGNADLSPEKGTNLDFGYKFESNTSQFSAKCYSRWSQNQIDWVKNNSLDNYYVSQNISRVVNQGIEFNFKSNLSKITNAKPISSFEINYCHNIFSIESAENTRYSFNMLKNQVTAGIILKLSNNLFHTFQFRIEDRANINYTYAILDSKTEYKLKKIPASFYLQTNNLTNTRYENFNGIELPRINFLTGCKFKL